MITINREIKENLSHYLIMILILEIGIAAYLYFSYDAWLRAGAVISTSVAYVLWGIIHHWLSEDLHFRVVLEYFVVALVAVVALLTLIFRS